MDGTLLLAALPEEITGSLTKLPIRLIGPGKVNAAIYTANLITAVHPRGVVLIGTCGGMRLLSTGLVVSPRAVCENEPSRHVIHALTRYPVDSHIPLDGTDDALIVTTDSFVSAPLEIASSYRQVAVDMETYAVARACKYAGVPLTVLKYVTDIVGQPNQLETWRKALPAAAESLAGALESLRVTLLPL